MRQEFTNIIYIKLQTQSTINDHMEYLILIYQKITFNKYLVATGAFLLNANFEFNIILIKF